MATEERGYLLDLAGYRFVLDGDNDNEELPQRARIRLIGVTVADNGELETTDVTISGGSGEFPETLDGDTVGAPDDNETIAYHIGSQQIVFNAQAVGELLERTGTATAGGSQKWKTGTGNPNGSVSAAEGGLFLSTDLHQLWQNTNGATAWERVWPLQIIDATGETPVAMPARPKVRILAGTVADNSGEGSTDITPSGDGGSSTFPIRFSWQTTGGGPHAPLTWDVMTEEPTLVDGIYIAELLFVGFPDDDTYGIAAKVIFRVKIDSGAVISVNPSVFDSHVNEPFDDDGPRNYYGSTGNTGTAGTLALSSGDIEVTVDHNGTPEIYGRLVFLDRVSL